MELDSIEEQMDLFYDLAEFEHLFAPNMVEMVSGQSLDTEQQTCDVEGKLYIKLNRLVCEQLDTKWRLWHQKDSCLISVHGIERNVVLKKIRPAGYHETDIVIFDIYEYFGPATVTITLFPSRNRRLTFNTTLHQVCSKISRQSSQSISAEEVTESSPHRFWGTREGVLLTQAGATRSSHTESKSPVATCEVLFAYIKVKSCLSPTDNHFHMIVQYGSREVLCDMLETLSRNDLLRSTLAVRSPCCISEETSDNIQVLEAKCGYLPLEHALLTKNKMGVEVLLGRAGNWCFQYDAEGRLARGVDDKKDARHINNEESHLPAFLSRVRYHCPYQVTNLGVSASLAWSPSNDKAIGTSLHAAILGGDTSCLMMVLRFLSRYSSVIINWSTNGLLDMLNWVGRREDHYTPLMLACALGKTQCIQMLLAEGVSLDFSLEPYHITPLMLVCSSGSLEAVKEVMSHFNARDSTISPEVAGAGGLQERGSIGLLQCSPYVTNIDGKQALGFAAENGHVDIVAYLIEKKLSYAHVDMFGSSSLHLAAANGHMEVCRVIVNAEAAAVLAYNMKNFSFKTRKVEECRGLHIDQQLNDKCSIAGLDTSTQLEVHDSAESSDSKSFSALPTTTAVEDIITSQSSTGAAGKQTKHHRVLTDMTPRPHVLRTVDKRGRTASEVAKICGYLLVANYLKSAEKLEIQNNAAFVAPRDVHAIQEVNPDDDNADQIAYEFAKTLYFDPSYDSVFSGNNGNACSQGGAEDCESDSDSSESELDSGSVDIS